MGKNIKRLSLALLALGLTAPAFADQCNPFQVTIPSLQGGFTIGADALYWKPSVPNGAYATVYGANVGSGTAFAAGSAAVYNAQIKSLDPQWQWGFDVTAAYRIPCTGNDISATWTYLNNNSNTTGTAVSADPATGVLASHLYEASLNFNNYNAVDLDVGQHVNFGDYFQFRLFTGLRWAQVEENIDWRDTFLNPIATGVGPSSIASREAISDQSKFSGIGPQFGIDGRYCLGYGFGLDGSLTTSLLVGTITASTDDFYENNPGGTATVYTALLRNDLGGNHCRVVPALDGKLGLDYTYNFNNCDRSSIVVQAGWKVINYFGVAHDMWAAGDHNQGGSIANFGGQFGAGLFANSASNVGFQGPYAGITVNL